MNVHRLLSGLCRDRMIPVMEQVLDRCTLPDGHAIIERLEIDAGAVALDRLEHDLAENVAQALEKSLREMIPPSASGTTALSGGIRHKTSQQVSQDVFIYFLRTGSLPWSFRLPAGSTLEKVILSSWKESGKSGHDPLPEKDAVLQTLANAAFRKRLILQFSSSFLEALLSLLSDEGRKIMAIVLPSLKESGALPEAKEHFAKQLWETMFARAAAGQAITTGDLLSEAWGNFLSATAGYPTLEKELETHWPEALPTPSAPRNDEISPPGDKHFDAAKSVLQKPLPRITSAPDITTAAGIEHPEAREGIYIDNAGLVLLHPFFPQFFEALELVSHDKLLRPERALSLLHFLATGQTVAPEYELVLPKILCNVSLSAPVETHFELTGAEKEEALALLKAVIRHWEALRQTSPDGLRGTFLLRPGKVSQHDDGDWFLKVETNAFDILLDQLPWGISLIKLPWMQYNLWVEWR